MKTKHLLSGVAVIAALVLPRQPGRNQPIHRAETLWVYPAPIPVGLV